MTSLADRWQHHLDELRTQGRYRTLRLPQGIDFASNDYLGYAGRLAESDLPNLPAPESAIRNPQSAIISDSGRASRLLRGHHAVWDEVETALARWHGAEAALVFNSGYVANEGLLSTLLEPHDFLASDQLNHASIIDGARLTKAERCVFRHNDLHHLESGLRQARGPGRTPDRQLFVITESLFGMDGDRAPLRAMVELCERHGAHLIVDEAHATGCFGPGGSGLVDAEGLRQGVLATVHTGGKALGVLGAYVCGSKTLRDLLINRCRHFIFTTALPATVGQWWLAALARVQADDTGRTALHAAAALFRGELQHLLALRASQTSAGLAVPGDHYIVPVLLGADDKAVRVAHQLQQAGWDMRAIRPPTVPAGTARLRISLHADHSPEVLRAAAAAVAEAVRGHHE